MSLRTLVFRKLPAVGCERVEERDGLAGQSSSGEGFCVAAPAVVGGVVAEVGAHGVEVDVGGHGSQGVAFALDEDGAEAVFPERAFALVASIEPLSEALLEGFHERADVPHAGEPAFAKGSGGADIADGSKVTEFPIEFVGRLVTESVSDVFY